MINLEIVPQMLDRASSQNAIANEDKAQTLA